MQRYVLDLRSKELKVWFNKGRHRFYKMVPTTYHGFPPSRYSSHEWSSVVVS